MTSLPLTSSQTVGPFFHDCLLRADAARDVLVTADTVGDRILIVGRVIDGDGVGVPDAVIEIWQANHHGRYNHPNDHQDLPLDPTFLGFGRTGTDAEGWYRFETIRPGGVPFDALHRQAPHISLAVLGRGLLNHLYTRLYFDGDPQNDADPMLLRVPSERRKTLLAQAKESTGISTYRFDIVLQGPGETVFFNLGRG